MSRLLWILALAPAVLAAADSHGAELARMVREAGLDAEECYRARDVSVIKDEVRVFFTDGYLIFSKPVNGVRLSAVFSADIEGGDGEVLVLPPSRSERTSLAAFTHSPNLNEHFKTSLMVFSDDTAALLAGQLKANAAARRSPEMGALLRDKWDPVVRNLDGSFDVRLVQDLLSGRRSAVGFFYTAIAGSRLGNFDVVYDPRGREQVSIGQVNSRGDRTFFDNWTVFEARSFRARTREAPEPDWDLNDIRLDATVGADLKLRALTRATLTPRRTTEGALAFEVSRQVRVTGARIDGAPAEVLQREALRANLIRGNDNDLFLVIPSAELAPGRPHTVEFEHEGDVISAAGDRVYYVGARGTWYPQRSLQFARYDLTFRYPGNLSLVSTGDVVEERTEGDQRVTRRRIAAPIRLAGFNLGDYERAGAQRGGYRVDVYANRRLESALQPKPRDFILVTPPGPAWPRGQRRPADVIAIPVEPTPPDPTARLGRLAEEIAAALEFMAGYLGPPPLKTLTVSPIPGTFGQGFPGLIYLSTLAYLDPKDRPAPARGAAQQTFFSEILHAHETAHQWWGNVVTSAGYRDDWLMEALANYSALQFLEKRKGTRALDAVLEEYRNHLLEKNEEGRTVESSGPVTWGTRLQSSQSPGAWRIVTYEKGSWIIHMLRRRLGDAAFSKLLGTLCARFRYKALDAGQFQKLAASFLPPGSVDPQLEAFFEHWVYGTGIPTLRFSYTTRGKAPAVTLTGTLAQSDVDEAFTADVPIQIQFAKGKPLTYWVRTSREPEKFTVTVRETPARVLLDPASSVLAVRK